MTRPSPCLTDEFVCFRSWASPLILHTLALPLLWKRLVLIAEISRRYSLYLYFFENFSCSYSSSNWPSDSCWYVNCILWYCFYISALEVFSTQWIVTSSPWLVESVDDVTVVLRIFAALTTFLISTAFVFLGWAVWTTEKFFFRAFHIVVLAMLLSGYVLVQWLWCSHLFSFQLVFLPWTVLWSLLVYPF